MSDNDSSQKLNLNLDLRSVVLVLLIAIVAMLLIWKPWSSTSAESRTVEVTGEAKVSAKPDEFVFYPTYQFEGDNKEASLASLTKKSDEVVAKLKELGVDESKIKTNSNGNEKYFIYSEDTGTMYSLQFTVTVDNFDKAQKVQDYLVTTSPTGSVSPQASFSDKKRKELENKARDAATKDARAKVERMADNLEFSIGKVKNITDGTGFNAIPYSSRGSTEPAIAVDMESTKSSLSVQPGENDLTYSVTVVYFIK